MSNNANQSPTEPKVVLRVDCRSIREDGFTLIRLLNDFDPKSEEGKLSNAHESAQQSMLNRRPFSCGIRIIQNAGAFALGCDNTENCGGSSAADGDFHPHPQ